MHRLLLATLAGGLLFTAAACSADKDDPAAAPAAAQSAAATSAAPASPYEADTEKVCGEVMGFIETDMDRFGAAVGRMIANKEAKSTAEAKKAQADAQKELRAVAKRIRDSSAKAQDPALVQAGESAAGSIEATAKDASFFARIDGVSSINGTLQEEMVSWVTPLSPHCG